MKVYVEVFGCTANKSDASLIKGLIKDSDNELVDSLNEADSIVILTCTVIDTTEQRMISRLKTLKKTGKPIVVTGCMASVQKEKVKSAIPDAKLLPPQYSHHIIDILNHEKPIFKDGNKTLFSKYFDDLIAPISIAEGCMFSCSYCITSLARGKLRSFPISEIKNDVCFAIKNGCKEIQLTAQDTSSYGLDIKSDLGILLRNITEVKGEYRIRVGMMNPYTCMKNLKSIITGFEDSRIYKFLHLPVQSGDNDILDKMNRKYNVEDFLRIVNNFKKCYPEITIATDVIVGFPSETNKQFQNTINFLKTVKPDITNITRFSARPYTKAKTMKGRIKTEIVKERSKILTEICREISTEKNKKHIGKKYNVLITEKGKNKTFVGRSENYKPIVLEKKVKIGDFLDVEITDSGPTYLVGSII
jgi:MiaB-like tRNA modifying enzyme